MNNLVPVFTPAQDAAFRHQDDPIATCRYVYEMGLSKQRYSYATAVGLFQSIISFVLVMAANWGSGKITGSALF